MVDMTPDIERQVTGMFQNMFTHRSVPTQTTLSLGPEMWEKAKEYPIPVTLRIDYEHPNPNNSMLVFPPNTQQALFFPEVKVEGTIEIKPEEQPQKVVQEISTNTPESTTQVEIHPEPSPSSNQPMEPEPSTSGFQPIG